MIHDIFPTKYYVIPECFLVVSRLAAGKKTLGIHHPLKDTSLQPW